MYRQKHTAHMYLLHYLQNSFRVSFGHTASSHCGVRGFVGEGARNDDLPPPQHRKLVPNPLPSLTSRTYMSKLARHEAEEKVH